jgi:hypothetical protein
MAETHRGLGRRDRRGRRVLADKPDVRLKTFTWTNVPGAYLVKP